MIDFSTRWHYTSEKKEFMSETYQQRQCKFVSACAKWIQVGVWQAKKVGRP